eukprot:g20497.t1
MPGAMENSTSSSRLGKSLRAMEQLRALHDGNDEVAIPAIVVAGEQSAGKSVLEALGGMKLPRGQKITTRVPLILSLQAVEGAQPHAAIGSARNGSVQPSLRPRRIFDELFQRVFEDQLASRSEELEESTKTYMQETLGKLCEHSCKGHPAILKALRNVLVEEFLEMKEVQAKVAVGSIVQSELDWVFTHDRSFVKGICDGFEDWMMKSAKTSDLKEWFAEDA